MLSPDLTKLIGVSVISTEELFRLKEQANRPNISPEEQQRLGRRYHETMAAARWLLMTVGRLLAPAGWQLLRDFNSTLSIQILSTDSRRVPVRLEIINEDPNNVSLRAVLYSGYTHDTLKVFDLGHIDSSTISAFHEWLGGIYFEADGPTNTQPKREALVKAACKLQNALNLIGVRASVGTSSGPTNSFEKKLHVYCERKADQQHVIEMLAGEQFDGYPIDVHVSGPVRPAKARKGKINVERTSRASTD